MSVLSDHLKLFRKCTPGWRGCTIAFNAKRGLFFTPPDERFTSPINVTPPPCKQALTDPAICRCISGRRLSPSRNSYFSEGEKRRPEIRLQFAGYFIGDDKREINICLIDDQPLKVSQCRV